MEPLNDLEKDFIKVILNEDVEFGNVDSNLGFVCDAIERSGLRGEQITESVVRRAISQVHSKLATNSTYAEAFASFFSAHPELRVEANETILVQESQHLFGAVMNAENLELVFSDPKIKAQLTFSEAYQARLTADRDAYNHELQQATTTATQGANMILDLTAYLLGPDGLPKGRTNYDKQVIQRRLEKETSDLLALSFDELSEKHAQWKYKRDLQSMSVEEVRKIVQEDDKARRAGYVEFRPLPQNYSPPGKEAVFIPWSQQLLTKLPAAELARLMQIYGSQQLNSAAAAQGRS